MGARPLKSWVVRVSAGAAGPALKMSGFPAASCQGPGKRSSKMRWAMPRLVVSRVLACDSWSRTSSASDRFRADHPVSASAPITTADTTSATLVAMLRVLTTAASV